MIKTVLIATAAIALTAGAAAAQDTAASNTWTGPYIGFNAGYNTDHSIVGTAGSAAGNINNVTNLARPGAQFLQRDGYVAGGQIGYNYQRGMVVGGVEADYDVTDARAGATYLSPATFGAALAGTRSDFGQKQTSLGTVRGRVGIANDKLFFYGTGGYAYGETKVGARFFNSAGAQQFVGGDQYGASGWAAGGGMEYALPIKVSLLHTTAITLKAEYLHYDLGDKQINVPAIGGVGAGAYVSTFHNTGDLIRGGVNFKF